MAAATRQDPRDPSRRAPRGRYSTGVVIDYERGRDPSLEIDLSPGDFEFAPIKTKSIKLTAKSKAPRVGLLEFRLGEVDKKLQAKE